MKSTLTQRQSVVDKKKHTLMCPYCAELIELPADHPRAIVAVCNRSNKSCEMKLWGSASTRVTVGGKIKLGKELPEIEAHAVQLDPPEAEAA